MHIWLRRLRVSIKDLSEDIVEAEAASGKRLRNHCRTVLHEVKARFKWEV